MAQSNKRKVCLALGAGGARGFAHVGVLEILEREGIAVAGITGSSAGSIAGAGYALGYSPQDMGERVKEFAQSDLAANSKVRSLGENSEAGAITGRITRIFSQGRLLKNLLMEPAILDDDYLYQVVEFFLPDKRLEEMRIPLAVVATDVITGQPVLLTQGSLREAVVTSCSVPGVAPAVQFGNDWLVDGGVASPIPVMEARALWGLPVLAVCVERNLVSEGPPEQALTTYLRAGEIQSIRLARFMARTADLVLDPQVGQFHWADFHCGSEIVEAGRRYAEAHARLIRQFIKGPSLWERLRGALGWEAEA